MCYFFFFKQKTAYEMRISDWSSDVCSSDLDLAGNPRPTADYANYYGTWAWERIFAAEDQAGVRHQGAAPRVVADMAGLGLKEDLIEMEGLDVGRNKVRRPYYDSATSPAPLHHFDHTQDGSVHPTHDPPHVPVSTAERRVGKECVRT